jgi:hypothetical protein
MSRPRSPCLEVAAVVTTIAAALVVPRAACAQSCCAGSSALTPGRLALHESALVGAQVRAGYGFGSFDADGHYATNPDGASELDFEQDLFGALRFLRHGQAALLVPFVETRRQTRTAGSELGGGLGDVNASARWDFTAAGQYRVLPGIGLLAGITFPTGRAPEDTSKPLATDATGVGAFQGNVGLALEQTWGAWLVNVTGLVAARTPRTVQGIRSTLGAQFTTLAALAYSLPDDSALAFVASYTFEGNATVDGAEAPGSGRRLLRLSVSAMHPLSDTWRLQGGVFGDPPIPHVGKNEPASLGLTLSVIRSWS